MKIERAWFENHPDFRYEDADEGIGCYAERYGRSFVYFEIKTDERIGTIAESCNWTNHKHYFNASCIYGWDGTIKTKKEHCKDLCTKALFTTAYSLLMQEYKNRK